ncbi:uncharacterized protein N7473_000901 [Penicillium subrubescens]|uniref:uncharacterized protein n=1 Tax=Penicillium subrubescens TaxID=1316194 RepID=UPI0025458E98|nr:uncharacterized protein N7473_000901 [Penicillium subrubescens]KAJ5911598.1 hypothetical protein N7473_000901 [Penicillium subrubescens]
MYLHRFQIPLQLRKVADAKQDATITSVLDAPQLRVVVKPAERDDRYTRLMLVSSWLDDVEFVEG